MSERDELPDPQSRELRKPLNYREQFQGRQVSQFVDPCAEASKASLKCMMKHDQDPDKCTRYFEAYRYCKKAWLDQRKRDRAAGRPTE